jgi:hypothetical protein
MCRVGRREREREAIIETQVEARPRFTWTPEALQKLRTLVTEGRTAAEIAKSFEQSVPCIENAIYRHAQGVPRGTLEENLDIPVFRGDLFEAWAGNCQWTITSLRRITIRLIIQSPGTTTL